MKRLLGLAVICMASPVAVAQMPSDWPALTQKPFADRVVPELGLRPLLQRSGKPITTKRDWQAQRTAIEQAWRDRLGPMPQRPKSLETGVQQAEQCDEYSRKLIGFQSADRDRIQAYLLIPDGLTKGTKSFTAQKVLRNFGSWGIADTNPHPRM
jgi:hypothetical protein